MRYFLHISYKGTHFHGWQRQENAHTVQEEIEKGLSKILRTEISIMGSGRTDTGVHASEQVAHFDTDLPIDVEQLRYKLNAILGKDIGINQIRQVKDAVHARFDATFRTYHYKLTTRKNPFAQDLISYYPAFQPHLEDLNRLAKNFVGERDFQSFSKVKTEVNNFRCQVTHARWTEGENPQELVFTITANRFLRGMVRAIVGTMLDIINGQIAEDDLPEIFAAQDRRKAGKAAKPEGLFLARVEYPEDVYV